MVVPPTQEYDGLTGANAMQETDDEQAKCDVAATTAATDVRANEMEEEEEEEEEKKEEGRAAKLSLIHDLERGLSSTEQTAAVRSYLASVHALPSNGQHLSALAKSASIDQQVQWLKSLRSQTEALEEEKAKLLIIKAALATLKEGDGITPNDNVANIFTHLSRAILLKQVPLDHHAFLRYATGFKNMCASGANGHRYPTDITKCAVVTLAAQSGSRAMNQLFGGTPGGCNNAFDMPDARHARKFARNMHPDPDWTWGLSCVMIGHHLRLSIKWERKGNGGEEGGVEHKGMDVQAAQDDDHEDEQQKTEAVFAFDATDFRPYLRVDDKMDLVGGSEFGNVGSTICDGDDDPLAKVQESLTKYGAMLQSAIGDDKDLTREQVGELHEDFKATAIALELQHKELNEELTKKRLKYNKRNESVELKGRQKVEITKARENRDKCARALDATKASRDLLQKCLSNSGCLDLCDLDGLLCAKRDSAMELALAASHYFVAYLQSFDNRVKTPVWRMAYGKKPTELQLEKAIEHVVGECERGGVKVTTVVADAEHRQIRRDELGAHAKKFVNAMVADPSGANRQTYEEKARRMAALCSSIISNVQPMTTPNLAGIFVPPKKSQRTAIAAADASAADLVPSLLGAVGIKNFNGEPFAFEAVAYKDPFYSVTFEDGDSEQMELGELTKLLVDKPRPFSPLGGGGGSGGGAGAGADDGLCADNHARCLHMQERCHFRWLRMCPDERSSGYEQTPTGQATRFIYLDHTDEPSWEPSADDPPATARYGGSSAAFGTAFNRKVSELNRLFPSPLVPAHQAFRKIPRSNRYGYVSNRAGTAVEEDKSRDRLPGEARNRFLSAAQEGRLVTLNQWRHDALAFAQYARLGRLGCEAWKIKPLRDMTLEALKTVAGQRNLSEAKKPYPPGTNSKTTHGKILLLRLIVDIESERTFSVIKTQLKMRKDWQQELTTAESLMRSGILDGYLSHHHDHQLMLLLDENLERKIDWGPPISEATLTEAANDTRCQYEK